MQRFVVAIGAVAVLAVAVVATAFAATSGDERIYACVNNGDGTVRIVSGPDVACAKGFHKLSWSAENPPSQHIPVTTTYTKAGSILWDAGDVFGEATLLCNGDDIAVSGGYGLGSTTQQVRETGPIFVLGQGFNNHGWHWEILEQAVSGGAANVSVVCQHTE